MDKKIIVTADGSHSISIPGMDITYHSTHGAIQESMHVFINAGLHYISSRQPQQKIDLLEMGFGTGLNALLTLAEAEKNQQFVYYETLELYPLEMAMVNALNYCTQLNRPDLQTLFERLHTTAWNTIIAVTPYFSFKKNNTSLAEYATKNNFNLVYFDAFAPEVQPALWTEASFKKVADAMTTGAVLTTYCSKSIVRKAMMAAGLTVEKIPGPPHKREIVRAVKK